MSVTGFLSLWIQNTSAASMMLPIVVALCKQLIKYNKSFQNPKSEEQGMEHLLSIFLKDFFLII